MPCLDMFNPEHQSRCNPPISPRISFSTDFITTQQMHKHERNTSPAVSSSSDFEFSVTNHNMMAADELFSRGKLLPFKDNCNNNRFQKMTLRDELLIEDNDNAASSRPPKSNSWKERLGLKRSNKGSSRLANVSKSSQEVLRDGDSSCRDVGEM